MNTAPNGPDWNTLAIAVAGKIVLPASPAFDSLRKSQVPRFDGVVPQAVVVCQTPQDVAKTIEFAKRNAIEVAPRSGGHCFAGHSSSEGIIIDVTPMSGITVANGLATVGAGARLGHVYDSLLEHGVTIPAGCGPTVGISGLTLGGGLGILGRTYGLTCDSLVAAQVVLADGSIVACNQEQEPDLFWALRGAGARNFGVVTALSFRPIVPPSVTAFEAHWPVSRAIDVISAWQGWSPTAPDELSASLELTAGSNPTRPPLIRVFGAMLGTQERMQCAFGELVRAAGSTPTSLFACPMTHRQAKRYLATLGQSEAGAEPKEVEHAYSKSEFFRQVMPQQTVVTLVEHLMESRVAGQGRELDLNPWGGEYNRVADDATAFVHRHELFLVKHTVTVKPEASEQECQDAKRWLDTSWNLSRPWGTGRSYQNFPDPDLRDFKEAYYGTNRERLASVKRRYDPDCFFSFEQSIGSGNA